ncbi:hypothetical protein [Fibrella forsythiae]|uniref:Uncharacterized protein n=1 Tax=Fibrella forsythiae TaxID=2817061 RepID=A0ABS3JR43_9BACT|nr:hypothetical protein [Fibrella forsythiae]MBO0952463.1 hypothetical protein [Fibrella forsythiae]
MTTLTLWQMNRPVPFILKTVYGETVSYASLVFIHGGTLLLTGLLWWFFRNDPILQVPELAQVVMWLLWDIAGGSLAHLTRANHQYWARLPLEMRLIALASMAWQPVVLVLVFNQPMLLLVELHLFAGMAFWLVSRVPLYLPLVVAVIVASGLSYQLSLPPIVALLSLFYCLKAVIAYRPEQTLPVNARANQEA